MANKIKTTNFHESLLLKHNNDNNSTSTSPHGTLSSTSSSISNTSSNSSNNFIEDIKILLPNGLETVKKIDTRKAIYDVLIELAASSKLQPSNHTLQLFNEEMKLLDYTPNQTLAQIAPHFIKLIPKSSTIKTSTLNYYSQQQLYNNNNSPNINTNNTNNKFILNNNNSIINTNELKKPSFEITIRVQVNLPHNQITALRVKPNVKLSDLIRIICDENLLDVTKYKLIVNSQNFDINENNYMNNTLAKYDANEVSLFYVNNRHKQQNEDYKIKNNSIQGNKFSEEFSRSKSEYDLHLHHQYDENNYKNDDDQKSNNKKSSILNIFRKKRSKTIVTEDPVKTDSITVQRQQTQQKTQQESKNQQNDNQSFENSSTKLQQNDQISNFSSKKKKAPPPPQPTQQLQQQQKEEMKIDIVTKNLSNGNSTHQSHKKKQAPLPPSLQILKTDERLESLLPTKFNSSTNSNSTTGTSLTNDTITNSSDKVTDDINISNSDNIKNMTEKDEQDFCNTNSLTSSLTSSKNCYQYENTANDSLSMTDNEDPVFNKEESIYNSRTQTVSSSNKYYDEYSISNNSKSSSMDDLTKSFAITIAVAEQYVAKDEAIKAESLTKQSIKSENVSPIKNHYLVEDEYSDAEVKIDLISNDSLNTTVNTNKDNSDIDIIDSNRREFVDSINSIINENNREIEVIYETFNQALLNKTKQLTNNNIENESIEKISEIPKDNKIKPKETTKSLLKDHEWTNYEEVEKIKQKSDAIKNTPITKVVYRNDSPSLTLLSSPESSIFNYRHSDISSPQLSLPSPDSTSSYLQRQSTPPVEHSSYKVIRPSDVYEKDGTFYSHDGTIRGYLGTVKKIATSKTLSEIFLQTNKDNENNETQKTIKVTQSSPTPAPSTPQTPKIVQSSPRVVSSSQTQIEDNNIRTSSSNSNDLKQLNNINKPVKSSLANILASEKKSGNINLKNNLTSSSLTNLSSKAATISNKITKLDENQNLIIKPPPNFDNVENVIIKTNVNLSHLPQNNTNNHHQQQKISPSFVMSAKSKSNTISTSKKSDTKETLVVDIKSIEEKKIINDQFPSPPPPELYRFSPQQEQISPTTLSFPPPPPPPIAPKNFSLKTINNKPALVVAATNRSNLFEAIKNFNSTKLRKTNEQQK